MNWILITFQDYIIRISKNYSRSYTGKYFQSYCSKNCNFRNKDKVKNVNTFQFSAPCIGMLVRLDRRGMMMIKEKLRLLLTALNLVEEGKRGAFQKRHVVRTSCSLMIKV